MNSRAQTHKLAELCAKTDRQLHTFISNRLDRGISFARLLLDGEARERWASLDEFAAQAETAYTDAARLMPLLRDIPSGERRQLQARLGQLREILDNASFCVVPRVHSAAML
jgi:hypothetical protein